MKKGLLQKISILLSVLIIFGTFSFLLTFTAAEESGVVGLAVPTVTNSYGYFIKTADYTLPKYGTSHNMPLGKAIAYFGIYEKNEDGSMGKFLEDIPAEYNDTTVAGFSLFSGLNGSHPWGTNDNMTVTGSQYSAQETKTSNEGYKYKTITIDWDWSALTEVYDNICMVQYDVGGGKYFLVLNYMAFIDYNDSTVISEYSGSDIGASPSLRTINDFEQQRKPAYSFSYLAAQTDSMIDAIASASGNDKKEAINAARKMYDSLDDSAKALVNKLDALEYAENTFALLDSTIEIDGKLDKAYEHGKKFRFDKAFGFLVSSSIQVNNDQGVYGDVYTIIDKDFIYFYVDVTDNNLVFNTTGTYNDINPAADFINYDGIYFYVDPDPSNNPNYMPEADGGDPGCKNITVCVDAAGHIYHQNAKQDVLFNDGYSKAFLKGNQTDGYTGYGIEFKLPRQPDEDTYQFNPLAVSPVYDSNNVVINDKILAIAYGSIWGHSYDNYAEVYYEEFPVIMSVNDVVQAINALPAAEDITDDTLAENIAAIRSSLDLLSSEQTALIDQSVMTHFNGCEQKVNDLVSQAKSAAAATDALITAIGTVTDKSGPAITAARDSYNALSGMAEKYVEKLSVLETAEAEYANITSVIYGDVNGDKAVTAADALLALQCSVQKITLNESQKKAADVDTKEGVTASDALLILQYSVNKIDVFPCQENK